HQSAFFYRCMYSRSSQHRGSNVTATIPSLKRSLTVLRQQPPARLPETVIVLGVRAITDLTTAIVALISLGILWRYKISEPIIVTISGLVGLILWPLVRGG